MYKKIFLVLLAIFFISKPVFANEKNICKNNNERLKAKLANIGLVSIINKNDEDELKNIVNKQVSYVNKKNIKKFSLVYDDSFSNFDGFKKEQYFKIIEDSFNSYSDIKYTSEIKEIKINGNYASVEVIETAKGYTKDICKTTKQKGYVESYADSIYYFKKFGKNWKIISDMILDEKTFIKYGEVNNIKMDLHAPQQVRANSDYDVILKIETPRGYYAIGSIQNEKIEYPQKAPKEVFRNIKANTNLERVIKSNSENKNEYAIASVAITKPSINSENKISINIVGMGFIMSRVNIIQSLMSNK